MTKPIPATDTAPAGPPAPGEHYSDCVLNAGPAFEPGPCDCGTAPPALRAAYEATREPSFVERLIDDLKTGLICSAADTPNFAQAFLELTAIIVALGKWYSCVRDLAEIDIVPEELALRQTLEGARVLAAQLRCPKPAQEPAQ